MTLRSPPRSIIRPLVRGVADRGFGGTSVQDVVAGACVDIHVPLEACHPNGSQTLKSQITNPADGSSGNGYFLGANASSSTDEPTFPIGPGDVRAYALFDGGDTMVRESANSALINRIGRTDQSFTLIMAIREPGTLPALNTLWSNSLATANTNHGLHLFINSSGTQFGWAQYKGAGAPAAQNMGAYTASKDTILALSYDHVANAMNTYLNSRTPVATAVAFGTHTADCDTVARISGKGGGGNLVTNTTRLYGHSIFNRALSAADIAKVFDVYNQIHGVTFA